MPRLVDPSGFEVEELRPDDLDACIDLEVRSFSEDPLLRFLAGSSHLERIVRPTLSLSFSSDAFLKLGIRAGSSVVAFCQVEPPALHGSAGLDLLRDAVRIERARRRSRSRRAGWPLLSSLRALRLAHVSLGHRPPKPRHYLSDLAVEPALRGRGMASALIRNVILRAAAHESSTGVALDTANAKNVPFFESLGFRPLSHARLSGVELCWMFHSRADLKD